MQSLTRQLLILELLDKYVNDQNIVYEIIAGVVLFENTY